MGWDATQGNPWAKHETVPVSLLLAIAYVGPAVVAVVVQLVYRRLEPGWAWKHDAHHFALALLAATSVTLLCTSVAKRYVGFYRPSYYSLVSEVGLSDKREHEGRQSYPSGHASLSFSSMLTVSLYCFGKTQAIAVGPGRLIAVLGCLSFVALAGFVACSRLVDYRHHPADINAGAGMGSAFALVFYHMYFPPVWQPYSHAPRGSVAASRRLLGPGDMTLPVSDVHDYSEE